MHKDFLEFQYILFYLPINNYLQSWFYNYLFHKAFFSSLKNSPLNYTYFYYSSYLIFLKQNELYSNISIAISYKNQNKSEAIKISSGMLYAYAKRLPLDIFRSVRLFVIIIQISLPT